MNDKTNTDSYDDMKELRNVLPSQFDSADEFQVSLHVLKRYDILLYQTFATSLPSFPLQTLLLIVILILPLLIAVFQHH